MALRKIVKIDEEKCNGCGECIIACAEGALRIIDGKARLVKEIYCDGLGACLGKCPEDAITVEEREAQPFDEGETEKHLEQLSRMQKGPEAVKGFKGCPGAKVTAGFNKKTSESRAEAEGSDIPSELSNWPVQLMLAPVSAPFFEDAELLLCADCVPFAYADFHRKFLRDSPLLMGCPKLDDAQVYVDKLAKIIKQNNLKSITVVHMEVPCCSGLVYILERALALSGKKIPVKDVTVSIRGDILEEKEIGDRSAA